MRVLAVVIGLMLATTPVLAQTPKLLSFQDILAWADRLHATRIAYGPDPLQFGELWLPATKDGAPTDGGTVRIPIAFKVPKG